MPSAWQALAVALTLPSTLAVTLDCKHITVGGHNYNLEPLKGPRTVHWVRQHGIPVYNTTYTIDLCQNLKFDDDLIRKKCPTGTQICSSETSYEDGSSQLQDVFPITGVFVHQGLDMDPTWRRLEDSESHEDAKREGLRLTMNGGRHPIDGSNGRKQRAIIEFVCNSTVRGDDGLEGARMVRSRAEGDNDDNNDGEDNGNEPPSFPDLDAGKPLQFVDYKEGNDVDTLRLTWQTQFACTDAKSEEPTTPKKAGWGFFTWFVIVAFLLVASYIIFGSWLNYNRYGARGWDLIPHGDTIRDLPYILKDFFSNLVSRIRGEGGSRGGYSAV